MKINRYWLIMAAANVILLALTNMVNDGVAPWSVALFLAGPCVVWPVLRLRTTSLLGCLVISGLAADAQLPTPPGFLMSLFVMGAFVIIALRPLLGRLGRPQQLMLAWLLNGAYFMAFTAWAVSRQGAPDATFWERAYAAGTSFWIRAAVDFCLSQIIVLPVSSWFFDFQESALSLAGLTVSPHPVEEVY